MLVRGKGHPRRLDGCFRLQFTQGDGRPSPTLEWSIDAFVRGVVERVRVAGKIAPFADEPTFDVTLAASGVRTQGICEIVPALAARAACEASVVARAMR